ncbi:hypothetical protein COCNU_scaffold000478G000050 [Cocos nucifera]|nr:hypothetical protein [Cocos nucifera]
MEEETFDPELIHSIFKLVWSRRATERNESIEVVDLEVVCSIYAFSEVRTRVMVALRVVCLDNNADRTWQSLGILPGFNNITSLETLYLKHNQLSGKVPGLDLSKLIQFNVSFNWLNGSIPVGLRRMLLDTFLAIGLCGVPLGACSPTCEKSKLSGGVIAGIAIGAVVGFLIVVALFIILCQRGRGSKRAAKVEVPRKLIELEMVFIGNGAVENENRLSVEVVYLSRYGKSLVFLKSGLKVYDLEDFLRASAAVLGKGGDGQMG